MRSALPGRVVGAAVLALAAVVVADMVLGGSSAPCLASAAGAVVAAPSARAVKSAARLRLMRGAMSAPSGSVCAALWPGRVPRIPWAISPVTPGGFGVSPQNRYDRGRGKLLEVYLPIAGPDGRPLLFESYQRLQLINLPLARSLASRLRGAHERALDASHRERRAIAADLHDGVVQDLAGVGFTFAAQAERINGSDPVATAALKAGRRGLGEGAERLLFRTAQELLRNAHRHGRARNARVAIRRLRDRAVLRVVDDGVGFDPSAPAGEGHFGTRVLRDLIDDAGGTLAVESAKGRGTSVRVEVPR
jgi:signal transduction histidine kinase